MHNVQRGYGQSSVKGVTHVFGLVYKSVCNEYMVSTSTTFGEGPLEGMGYVGIGHELALGGCWEGL